MDFGLPAGAQPQEWQPCNSLSSDEGPAAEASRLEFARGKRKLAGCEDGVAVRAGFEIDCSVHREPPVVTLGLARKTRASQRSMRRPGGLLRTPTGLADGLGVGSRLRALRDTPQKG